MALTPEEGVEPGVEQDQVQTVQSAQVQVSEGYDVAPDQAHAVGLVLPGLVWDELGAECETRGGLDGGNLAAGGHIVAAGSRRARDIGSHRHTDAENHTSH